MISRLLILAFASSALADDPCSPRLEPMVTTRIPVFDTDGNTTGTIQTVSVAETETRNVVADYLTPEAVDTPGLFSVVGETEATNLSSVARKVRFRQSVRIGEGMVPVFDEGSELCWDPGRTRIVRDYLFTLDPGEKVIESISWSASLRLEGMVADINADGWVDGIDQGILLGDWGSSSSRSDLNLDGVVNGEDLGILFSQWSESSDDLET